MEAWDGLSEVFLMDYRLYFRAVRSVLVANEFKHFSIVLEPMIRKVVRSIYGVLGHDYSTMISVNLGAILSSPLSKKIISC